MDYYVINGAINDIVWIVNQYNKEHGYDVSLCEKLVLALLGYYLAFGADIFTNIDVVLEQLKIYQCESELRCILKKKELVPDDKMPDANPGTKWDYCYDKNKKFIGAIPTIIFYEKDMLQDVFTLVHELSHTLEGVNGSIIYETDTEIKFKYGFGEYFVDKNRTGFKKEGHGMTELITITIENKVLREFRKLDPSMIVNPLVKEFIEKIKKYQDRNILLNSYGIMASLFKDLIDNEAFFELIRKYYYENEREFFIEEFNSWDERLDLKKICYYVEQVYNEDEYNVFYYAGPIRKQLEVVNEVTGFEPDNKMLIMI